MNGQFDPFEVAFTNLLEVRKKVVEELLKHRAVDEEPIPQEERLPFNIYKTNQRIKENEQARKALKTLAPE